MALKKPSRKNNPTESSDSAEYSAAKLEEQETREDLENAINKGINLSDSDEPVEHELLCGYTDKDGVKHTTYTIREMTGRDEEAVDKPEFKTNPSKGINVILSRIVQSIGTLKRKDFTPQGWDEVIKGLYTGDQDLIMMEIRKMSVSNEITAKHKCPNCGQKLTTVIDIDELEIVPFKGKTVEHFTLPRGYKTKDGELHREGKVRLATGLDREILTPLARKNLSKANTVLLTRTCTFDDGLKVDDDVTAGLVVKDREYLADLLSDMSFGYKLQVEVTCDQCGEEFIAGLNAVNFT